MLCCTAAEFLFSFNGFTQWEEATQMINDTNKAKVYEHQAIKFLTHVGVKDIYVQSEREGCVIVTVRMGLRVDQYFPVFS